jgi:aspartate carbamoyltransferase catalytic subunit
MQERLGSLEGKNVVIVGDILHSRVALSNIFGLQKLGAKVAVSGPSTLIPRAIHELGVEVIPSVDDALEWADVANVLRVQHERMDRAFFPSVREYHARYGITMDRLKRLSSVPLIMHPGPINRGVELTSEVADSPYAAILNQVENGVAVRMAVLYLLAAQSSTHDVV